MALRGRRIDNYLESWCLVCSESLDIWVLSTSFKKSNIHWPQQPLTEKVLKSVQNWIFDDLFHKNGPASVFLVPGTIQSSRSGSSLMKKGFRGCWGHWGCRGRWGCWGCRGSNAWKITNEDFRVIQVLDFSFILMFWKNRIWGRITKYHFEF